MFLYFQSLVDPFRERLLTVLILKPIYGCCYTIRKYIYKRKGQNYLRFLISSILCLLNDGCNNYFHLGNSLSSTIYHAIIDSFLLFWIFHGKFTICMELTFFQLSWKPGIIELVCHRTSNMKKRTEITNACKYFSSYF